MVSLRKYYAELAYYFESSYKLYKFLEIDKFAAHRKMICPIFFRSKYKIAPGAKIFSGFENTLVVSKVLEII